jgi:biotin-(acetyl-CoA carboxylase) ligase
METDDSQVSHVTLGIGLNVNNDAERVIPTAVSLKSLLGFPVQRREIFLLFLERFSDSIATFDRDRVVVEWKENNCTIGRMVKIETLKSRTEGRAVDIDHYGGLVIRSPDGTDEIVNYGDCFITD